MLDILETVENWRSQENQIALATVVSTWGSSPRKIGAKMGIKADMGMTGSVSGGCVETAVAEEALDSLKDKQPRLLSFGVSDDSAWEVGLACGGQISVFVEPLDMGWWDAAAKLVREDKIFATVTILDSEVAGQKALVTETGIAYASADLSPSQREIMIYAAQGALREGVSAHSKLADAEILVDVYMPAPRLIIIGGAHVALALNQLAQILGFRVFLIDPRKAFATEERFPDVELISHQYPDKILPDIGVTSQTYVAILTHDPKIDDPAIRATLDSPAPYIGILSSRRTHEKRIERLTKAGLDPELLKRIRTPIGINIGATQPEEIALSIMAEIVAVRNDSVES